MFELCLRNQNPCRVAALRCPARQTSAPCSGALQGRKALSEQLQEELRQQMHEPMRYIDCNQERHRVATSTVSASGAAADRTRGAAAQQPLDASELEAACGRVPRGYWRIPVCQAGLTCCTLI